MAQPAVFLDRDGTLIEEVHYAARPEQIRILGGTAKALARLSSAGYKLVVVTNQSGIARGLFTEADLERFHRALDEQLHLLGARVDAYYTCPHHPDPSVAIREDLAVECDCRKPKPGLILRAAEDLDVDLESSWIVGDAWRDIQAGQAAGVQTIKLPSAAELDDVRPPELAAPTADAADLNQAADIILGETRLEARAKVGETRMEISPEAAPRADAEATPTEAETGDETPSPLEPERAASAEAAPSPEVQTAAATEEADRPAEALGCARCGQEIPAPDLASGAAGRRGGFLLCAECLSRQPPDLPDRQADDTAALLRETVTELRRLDRSRGQPSLSLLRLLAYILQAAALLAFLGGLVLPLGLAERTRLLQITIFLQLLVLTLVVFEGKS